MKDRKQKTFEFLTLLCMVVGIVIGSGEFVKNDDNSGHVLGSTQNATMGILVWIFIGIGCLFMMLCFIEVTSATLKNGNGTISNLAKLFIGRKAGSFTSLFWIFIYLPIMYSLLSLFGIKYLLISLDVNMDAGSLKNTIVYIFGSLGFLLFFTLLNTYFRTAGKYFQIIGTFLKLIPFILILLIGFIFPAHPNAFTRDDYQTWNVTNFFTAVGPILYSFDGFIFAANLQKETKNKDVVYKALLVGILIIVIVYVLEAAALFTGTDSGVVSDLFENVFHTKNVDLILNLMIVMAIIVGLNGYTLIGPNYIVNDSEQKLIYTFKKRISFKKSSFFQMFLGLVWLTLFLLLGLIIDNGIHNGNYDPTYFSDLFSNILAMFGFITYSVVLIGAIINRFTKKVEVKKVKFMILYAIISLIILGISIIYSLYITFIENNILTYLLIGTVIVSLIIFGINEYLLRSNKKIDEIEPEENKTKFKITSNKIKFKKELMKAS